MALTPSGNITRSIRIMSLTCNPVHSKSRKSGIATPSSTKHGTYFRTGMMYPSRFNAGLSSSLMYRRGILRGRPGWYRTKFAQKMLPATGCHCTLLGTTRCTVPSVSSSCSRTVRSYTRLSNCRWYRSSSRWSSGQGVFSRVVDEESDDRIFDSGSLPNKTPGMMLLFRRRRQALDPSSDRRYVFRTRMFRLCCSAFPSPASTRSSPYFDAGTSSS
mmetsp:Transcript_3401/g.9514  ORF Transcript_3401/g.9514 Transcript_3401/m.9514 type:complete len:216 (-) Transcript_3401:2208-2855(-)